MRASVRPYTQVARAKAQARTRDALLDVAEATFFAGRWKQASLGEMAGVAGLTKQTLLRHFGSKDGLLEAASQRASQRVRDQRWQAPPRDLRGALENLLDHYEEYGERAMKIAQLDGQGAALADVGKRARRLHYDWVEHAFGESLDRFRGSARARRRAALIVLCDVHSWWLLSHDLGLARSEVRNTLIQAIRSLLGEEA